jgi:hypothetical protein
LSDAHSKGFLLSASWSLAVTYSGLQERREL